MRYIIAGVIVLAILAWVVYGFKRTLDNQSP
jgi:hypothetical protein